MKHSVLAVLGTILVLILAAGPFTTSAQAYGGGGGGGDEEFDTIGNLGKRTTGGGGGASWGGSGPTSDEEEIDISTISPKALDLYKKAGGKAGTGLSFPKWLEQVRAQWEGKQTLLTWDAKKAGWKASAWNVGYYGSQGANIAGKGAQFVLNFVPGFGWICVGLDATRGLAEGYAEATEQGLELQDAVQVGVQTGMAQGVMSFGFNKFGMGNRFGTEKAVKSVISARSAKQILRSNKALKKAVMGNVVDTGVQEVIGNMHTSNAIENSSPLARLAK